MEIYDLSYELGKLPGPVQVVFDLVSTGLFYVGVLILAVILLIKLAKPLMRFGAWLDDRYHQMEVRRNTETLEERA